MENLPVIFYVMFAIQVIACIVFFVMANNISIIKKRLSIKSIEEYMELAKMEAYVGNKDEAKKLYMRARYLTANGDYMGEYRTITFKQIDDAIAELDKE